MCDAAPDSVEQLRRSLTAWYRHGEPWNAEPTLADFRRAGRMDRRSSTLLEELIARHGPDMKLQSLRLLHLVELV
jgi:hypothetical protein